MFYEFRQNNSGGSFQIDERQGLTVSVIVEADDYEDANDRAQRIGLYFDGCEDGRDCSCCGDRWYAQWKTDGGEEVPSIYGTPLIEATSDWGGWAGDKPEVFVHLKDGRRFGFHLHNGRYVYKGDPRDLVEALPATVPVIES